MSIPKNDFAVRSKKNSAHARSKRILLAEDDPEMSDLLSNFLKSEGYSVETVANGDEAMAYARENESEVIDLLVTDLVMPSIGGLQLAGWFRDKFPATKILIISGFTDEMVIFQENLTRDTTFLPKPLRFPAFKTKVAEILAD